MRTVLLLLALSACSAPPPTPIEVGIPDGLCWPKEPDAAYAEYQVLCGLDGRMCPATTEWRGRLGVLKALVGDCE